MIKNEEFSNRLYQREYKIRFKDRKDSKVMYINKNREEKQKNIHIAFNERIEVTVGLQQEGKFYREKYHRFNVMDGIQARQRNIKEYYCSNNITVDELEQMELEQMQNYYNKLMQESRKSWIRFISSYVMIDYRLMLSFIHLNSSTPQQAYKKRIMFNRHIETYGIDKYKVNLFEQLERMKPQEKERIKQMIEYNKKRYNSIGEVY